MPARIRLQRLPALAATRAVCWWVSPKGVLKILRELNVTGARKVPVNASAGRKELFFYRNTCLIL